MLKNNESCVFVLCVVSNVYGVVISTEGKDRNLLSGLFRIGRSGVRVRALTTTTTTTTTAVTVTATTGLTTTGLTRILLFCV